MRIRSSIVLGLLLAGAPLGSPASERTAFKNAYFGDLHVHTAMSFDAFIWHVRGTPDDAYRFAKGEAVRHASGEVMRLSGPPLDFLAVTDHAEYLGVMDKLTDPDHPFSKLPSARRLIKDNREGIQAAFDLVAGPFVAESRPVEGLWDHGVIRQSWQEAQAAADRHYEPGVFTTIKGFEYTSSPTGHGNLHRNVFFRTGKASDTVFSLFDSPNPEDLWRWLDEQRSRGIEVLAVPHNPNWSRNSMFARVTYSGEPVDAEWAERRVRNEPLVEITQIKGTSETNPALSPNDEWADFALYLRRRNDPAPASYVRSALLTGLSLADELGINPYRLGIIGSTDAHNAASTFEEDALFGFSGLKDGTAELRQSVPPDGASVWPEETIPLTTSATVGASGLAGVWAEENTREAIFDALARRETFATSGPRIRVRFFGGYGVASLISRPDFVEQAYRKGVPMGGELKSERGQAPEFLVWAVRDPNSTWLQRVQIVKGWLSDGKTHERVYDVACSDGLQPGATHRCPDNGAQVDLRDCSVSRHSGSSELRVAWRDPDFERRQPAFYYVRVLENPTCRWSTWESLRAGVERNPQVPAVIQERAWSSPIWYSPR